MLALALAFFADLVIGDPVYAWHPVRLMGRAIEKGENLLRKKIRNEKHAGAMLAFSFPVFTFCGAWLFLFLLKAVHPVLAFTAETLGIYFALSIRDLRKEALQIQRDLEEEKIFQARRDLARIVGRDTQSLDPQEILRAAIETVAESTLDGIVAPLFYAALGGAPLVLAYKAVNTLDSMVGHLNDRYRDFGFWAAKQDEAWNWIPARISYFLILMASVLTGRRTKETLRAGWQDGMIRFRGNGAIPEASFAGALGVRLGGVNFYEGRRVEKPFLGVASKPLETRDLRKSIHLMMFTAWTAMAFCLCLRGFLGGIF